MIENTQEWQTYVNWLTERGLTQPQWRDDVTLAALDESKSDVASTPDATPLEVVFLTDVVLGEAESQLVAKMAGALKLNPDQWTSIPCVPDQKVLASGIPPAAVLDRLGQEMWARIPAAKSFVAFGPLATRIACGKGSFRTMRGQTQASSQAKIMPTYHPRDLAKRPELKRDVWTDLQKSVAEAPV